MQRLGLMSIAVLFMLFYSFSGYRYLKTLAFHRKLIAFFLIVSIAIGVDYIFLDLLASMSFHHSTQEDWTNMISVCIFTLSESMGVWQLIRNQNEYRLWVIPALADLFVKGSIAFIVFGNSAWLIWDSFRAIFLLILIYYDYLYFKAGNHYVYIHHHR